MNCPSCQAVNVVEAVACAACGSPLPSQKNSSRSVRRSGSRRRDADPSEAAEDSQNPVAWRAYRLAVWSIAPGLGLILGPVGVFHGWRAARRLTDDLSARNRARTAVFLSAGSTVTQWLGIALIYHGWN
jgi:hypothetical protein